MAQYLTNERQGDNEFCLVNRILQWKYFSLKIMQKNEVERLVPNFLLFFEKALYEVKVSGLRLSFDIF